MPLLRKIIGTSRRKDFIRRWVPQGARDLANRIAGYTISYEGSYKNWHDAEMAAAGYDATDLVTRLVNAARTVKRGEAAWEQDGVIHTETPSDFPVLTGLLRIALERRLDCLHIVDFGGGFGSSYYQCRAHLPRSLCLDWRIVEQPSLVRYGIAEFTTPQLRFFPSLEAATAIEDVPADVVLLSSVLQYLEHPYRLLDEIAQQAIPYLLIDRHPCSFTREMITVQHIPASLYRASYPSWLFDRQRFIEYLERNYELISQWDGKDPPIGSNRRIGAHFQGFLFRRLQEE